MQCYLQARLNMSLRFANMQDEIYKIESNNPFLVW